MGLTMCLERLPRYILARVEGRFELEAAKENFIIALETCAERGATRVLMDWRKLGGEFSLMERYELGKFGAKAIQRFKTEGRIGDLRIAFLVNEVMIDPQGFGENVAVNRGAPVRVTVDRAEALGYLGVEEASETEQG
jgi:hypothetical protein